LRFGAVAVIAAINLEGKVVALKVKDFSIKKQDVIDFLKMLRWHNGVGEHYVFLDNLPAHHSKEVKEVADLN
jgi:transposase